MTDNIHATLLKNVPPKFHPLKSLLEENGALPLPSKRAEDLTTFLSKTIIGQQLSKGAANSIWGKVEDLSIAAALPITNLLSGGHNSKVKACGVSRYKVKALNCLHAHFTEYPSLGKSLHTLSNIEIANEIKKIWGIGQWSAEMALIFYFNREDIWSLDDAALSKGIKILTNNDLISHEEISEIVKNFSPFRTYLALHIWRGIDQKYI